MRSDLEYAQTAKLVLGGRWYARVATRVTVPQLPCIAAKDRLGNGEKEICRRRVCNRLVASCRPSKARRPEEGALHEKYRLSKNP
jgi:hypothetical protein